MLGRCYKCCNKLNVLGLLPRLTPSRFVEGSADGTVDFKFVHRDEVKDLLEDTNWVPDDKNEPLDDNHVKIEASQEIKEKGALEQPLLAGVKILG